MPNSERPFGIADAMILVATVALGFGVIPAFGTTLGAHTSPVFSVCYLASAFLFACSFGALVIRLRKPRPSLRCLIAQPGYVGCISVFVTASVMAPKAILEGLFLANLGVLDSLYNGLVLVAFVLPSTGTCVLVSWTVLALGGHLRAERSWIDIFGVTVGVGWILVGAFVWYDVRLAGWK